MALSETGDNADWLCQRAYAHILLKDYNSKCVCVCVLSFLYVLMNFLWSLYQFPWYMFVQNDSSMYVKVTKVVAQRRILQPKGKYLSPNFVHYTIFHNVSEACF